MWFLIWFWLLQPAAWDTPQIITLTGGAGPVDVIYTTDAPQMVTISARSLADEPIDVTLAVLLGNQQLAFNDDHMTADSGLQPGDARLAYLQLPQAGDYTLRVHSFNGAQSGAIEVSVQPVDTLPACEMPLHTVSLRRGHAFTCTLALMADDRVTITAHDTSGVLDPLLRLYDSAGREVAFNDDHGTADAALNLLDARIADFSAPADGVYTVHLTDFTGQPGIVALMIDISS